MTLPTFVPGYLGTVIIDAEDVSAIGNVLSLNLNKPTQNKPVFGSKWGRSIPGQRTGTFSASGHIAAEKVAALFALFDGDDPVDFSLQIGEAGQATDGGLIQGKCNINTFTIDASADGEWEWSIQAATDGAVQHTPPTP
jgi:predicted secreted protein